MGISVTRAAARFKTTTEELKKLEGVHAAAVAAAEKAESGVPFVDASNVVAVAKGMLALLRARSAAQEAALARKTTEYPIKLRRHLERCRRGGIADSRRAAARAAK